MKLKTIVRAIALLGVAAPALAQTADVAQRVEITGSSIKRIASEGALPVQVITSDDLKRQGIVTAEQLMSTLSVAGNGMDNLASNSDVAVGSGRGNNGLSAANLRGQGAMNTLVLLNGRRLAAHALNGGIVDLNQIPMAAVERVEILKDGASSVYGTDAIGGVINFILRKNYNGLQVQGFTDVTQQGGGNVSRVNVVGGLGDLDRDRYNLLVALDRSDNQALRGDQRSFVNTFQSNRGLSVDTRGTPFATVVGIGSLWTALSNKSSTGPTLPGGGTQTYNSINALNLPGGAGCNSIAGMAPYDAALWLAPASKYACAFDTGVAAVLQQPVTDTNLVVRGTLRLGEHQLFAEFTGAKVESAKTFSANQITSSATATLNNGLATGHGRVTIPNPFLNLAYPGTGASYNDVFNALVGTFPQLAANAGKPLAFRWRCTPCGPREVDTSSDTSRFLLGAEGPLKWLAGWDYRAGVSLASSEASSVLGNGYYYSVPFAATINSGLLSPFLAAGQSQTPEAMAALQAASARGVTLYGGKFTLMQTDATATGPLFKLPAGDVMAAVGTDLRTEKYRFNGSATDFAAQLGIFNAPFDAINTLDTLKRDIKAVYAEMLVPITKTLEATLAVRHDDYSDFGGTTNPKLSFRFTPVAQLLTRGSYSTGFRAPTFSQLFNGITESPYSGAGIVDPLKCPSLVPSSAAGSPCNTITFNTLFGGVSTLKPETSKQGTVGFVFAPTGSTSVGADWWTITKNGTIQSLSVANLVANYALIPQAFIRDPSGTVVQLDQRWINAGQTVTTGVDINASANGVVGGARWGVLFDGSYLIEKKTRLIDGAPFGASEVGRFNLGGDPGLRWKHSITGTYSRGPWTGTLTQLYRSGYQQAMLPGVANGSVIPPDWNPNVSSYTLYSASVGYSGIKNLGLTFGIKNLFNTNPPFAITYDTNTGAGSSWDPRVADPRGRSFTFMLDYKFF